MAKPKKLDATEAHARLDRLNTWVGVLHKRVEALEKTVGMPERTSEALGYVQDELPAGE